MFFILFRHSRAEQSMIAFDCPENLASQSGRYSHDRFKQQFSSEDKSELYSKRNDSMVSEMFGERSNHISTMFMLYRNHLNHPVLVQTKQQLFNCHKDYSVDSVVHSL